ncbi:MAG: hypothetical protein A2509_07565 [Candidatus Edwardsbacteria bacterium RIFOXYD12_FULL_50_11]|uniref:Uncharacterized protein n=1 Tax=Candidatus Edwardsbacteria bacterium GWF2_54_11 TaxID=1817851 RepID=A0A1F5RE61_9BACT|nr:MAG: hypothetical protein A2502_00440 [Candidatus Edwardsbacteria bacterium RifOxyC12_full_54_24]OGF06090.1 MAG: hypothetical protein A2273_09910 [Candidatus Edwardsbacteria bacterium RifOxyA12_full_54_48]OGF12672.1 MAG: hypothetical protein A2024_00375 [Candidatus Edwardsbacteria bacterium GWF2_54_11]OGF17131.1 MAG: hypothetical protein A2509_07565 [Candidatus Edwardsbacteria bacterium RIFOXYD12_FULL_50_11]OGJ18330.1 MAG: hypothetical protein A2349_11755 [Candidatus Edwardsbacteria bacteriu
MPQKPQANSYNYNDPDPYLRFDGPVYDITPREFIPLIDTIRRMREWQALGFSPKRMGNGNYKPIIRKGCYYGFREKTHLHEIETEAVASGKKVTREPGAVFSFLLQGCTYDDFLPLPENIVSYCECRKALGKDDLETALYHIERSYESDREKTLYAILYFEVRLKLGDKSAILDEFKYFQDDIDCLIHSGRVYEWLKYLSSQKDYAGLNHIIKEIEKQLDALIQGQIQHRRYTPQRVEFYVHEKEQLIKKTASLRKRIEVGLAKQQNTKVNPM